MVAPWWPKLTELQGPVADPVNTAGINLTGDPALGGLLGRRGTGKCETRATACGHKLEWLGEVAFGLGCGCQRGGSREKGAPGRGPASAKSPR